MILSYHNIASVKGFYTLSYDLFREQMEYVKDTYKIVSIKEYVDHIKKHGRSEQNAVVITFDDAYESFATMAVPLLTKLKMPSALFVCTGYIGKSNEWNEEANRYSIMGTDDIVKLSRNDLVTIGAHTVFHPVLASLQRPVAYFELNESKRYLEELIGRKVDYVAYPYGQINEHVNQMVFDLAKDIGYKGAFTTNYGFDNSRSELFHMNRIDVAAEDDLQTFIMKLQPDNPFYQEQKRQNLVRRIPGLKRLGYVTTFELLDCIPAGIENTFA